MTLSLYLVRGEPGPSYRRFISHLKYAIINSQKAASIGLLPELHFYPLILHIHLHAYLLQVCQLRCRASVNQHFNHKADL